MRCLLALLCLAPVAARADCAASGWHVFPPPGSTVPTNARFVVQGFASSQAAVKSLATRHPRLVADTGEQLPLKVLTVNEGGFELTQAVLAAKGALTPGVRYTLRFDDDTFSLRRGVSASWVVGAGADFEPPRWQAAPSAKPGERKEMGCGPSVHARLELAVEDAGPVLVRAVVKRDGEVKEFLLEREDDGSLRVGHGMCSGAFQLGDGAWTLELSAVDLAGNSTPAPGGAQAFKGLDPA